MSTIIINFSNLFKEIFNYYEFLKENKEILYKIRNKISMFKNFIICVYYDGEYIGVSKILDV